MRTTTPEVLSHTLLAELAQRGDLQYFAAGDVVIREGEISEALYVLVRGKLKVFTGDARGRELVYNVLGPGEVFGEMFLDGGPRSASVKAIEPAHCAVVHERELRAFMQAYPEFAELLVVRLIGRLRHATRTIRSFALDGVYERVVALIEQNAVEEDGRRIVPSVLTQQEIADRIGATREMVNHVIRELVRGGYLKKIERRRLLINGPLPSHW